MSTSDLSAVFGKIISFDDKNIFPSETLPLSVQFRIGNFDFRQSHRILQGLSQGQLLLRNKKNFSTKILVRLIVLLPSNVCRSSSEASE